MQLKQRNANTYNAEPLPMGDNEVVTGHMGDCVSVIVLFNPNAMGNYASVRGYHGGGGLGNVNYNSLFAGVPNLADTRIIMVSGSLQNSHFARNENQNELNNQRMNHGLGNAQVQYFHAMGNARIDRRGMVRPVTQHGNPPQHNVVQGHGNCCAIL